MSLFKLKEEEPKPSWFSDGEQKLRDGFFYLMKKPGKKLLMVEFLLETELANLLADLHRSLMNWERRKISLLNLRIDDCLVNLWEARLRRSKKA